MADARDLIVLRGISARGHHGVSDEERALPQPIEVDLELALDLRAAGRTDDLSQTLDYGSVIERCIDVVERRSFRLLEALAETLAEELLATGRVDSVRVTVRKLQVPVAGRVESAAVSILRAGPGDPREVGAS